MILCKECYKYAIGTLHTPKNYAIGTLEPTKKLSALPILGQLDGLTAHTQSINFRQHHSVSPSINRVILIYFQMSPGNMYICISALIILNLYILIHMYLYLYLFPPKSFDISLPMPPESCMPREFIAQLRKRPLTSKTNKYQKSEFQRGKAIVIIWKYQ